ncbi:AAA family ATPase [Rufibacter soli]
MKINPFKPNSPSNPGMFVGRFDEIEKIESALIQTRANQSQSFLLLGERGIGKTSLMNLVKFFAEGDIEVRDTKLNFLVIEIDITKDTSQLALIRKIQLALKRKLAKTEKAKKIFNDIWNFISSIEAAGVKFNKEKETNNEILFEEFSYSLADTINRITSSEDKNQLDASYDGLLIIIDEADNSSPTLELGSFVKLLTERLQKEGTEKIMFGIAGLPKTRDILIESHPSSIRIFEELYLDRLKKDEIKLVFTIMLKKSKELNGYDTVLESNAEELLINFTEGFPHFVHQYGFCSFEESNGKVITENNVLDGAFGKNGAIETIGSRYYKDDFYNKIKTESYRQVLLIMANQMDSWVTKSYLKENFNGSDTILNNAITALISRNIIIPKPGERGTYRLQDKGFAWWIIMNQKKEDGASVNIG